MRDPIEFPALSAFLHDVDAAESEFRHDSDIDQAYEQAKIMLRRNAGAYGTRRTVH